MDGNTAGNYVREKSTADRMNKESRGRRRKRGKGEEGGGEVKQKNKEGKKGQWP